MKYITLCKPNQPQTRIFPSGKTFFKKIRALISRKPELSHEEELFSTKAFRGSVSFHVIHSCLIRLGKHTSLTITPIFRLHPPSQKLYWKLGQHSAICWNSLGLFRDSGLNYNFFRNKTFFVFQDRKLKLSASV